MLKAILYNNKTCSKNILGNLKYNINKIVRNFSDYRIMNMPALSPTMETGKITKWYVKVGDEVGPGDLLADVETDKSTMGWEIQDDGVIAKL